jgi:heme A synthase
MPTASLPSLDVRRRAIRLWLLAVAALVAATLVIGGATRLTESGLSIVEWKPVTGTLPPLAETEWQAEFEKYRAIPQYRIVNRGMTLDQFKTIYRWEWAHRLSGPVRTRALTLAAAVTIQAALGILTLLSQAPIALALMHQAMAIAVLTIAVVHAERVMVIKSPMASAAAVTSAS